MRQIVITPNRNTKQCFKELWLYRELFLFLAWKDVLVRYKQTAIGIAWSVLRPLLTMVIFTFVFGKLAQMPSENIPYPILVYAALLPWQFFSNTISESSNSVIVNRNLVTKVYFPRIIIPSTSLMVNFIDFLISFCLLLVLMFWYGHWPNWRIFVLPFLLLMAALTSLGIGYFISSMNVKYRDFRYMVPFLVRIGLYISPVGFSSTVVPEKWRFWYSLNPMVGVIDGFRWALLGKSIELYVPGFLFSIAVAVTVFFAGAWFFNNVEHQFADII